MSLMAGSDNPLRVPEALQHAVEEIFKITGPFWPRN